MHYPYVIRVRVCQVKPIVSNRVDGERRCERSNP